MQAELSWDLRPPFPPYVGLLTHARFSEKVIDSHVHHSLRVYVCGKSPIMCVCMYVCILGRCRKKEKKKKKVFLLKLFRPSVREGGNLSMLESSPPPPASLAQRPRSVVAGRVLIKVCIYIDREQTDELDR